MKKKMFSLCFSLVLIGVILSGCIENNEEKEDAIEYLTYKEFYDKSMNDEFKPNDTALVKDEIINIWYNSTTNYTYFLFKSMEGKVEFEWGYDAGHPGDDTDSFSIGDKIIMKIIFTDKKHPSGGFIGNFESIELAE
jgi:hypothetical protein